MLGASIYLSQEVSEIKEYLFKLSKNNVKEIFTSIHIGEEDPKGTLEKLTEVSKYINSLNMQLMIDISSATLTRYDFTFDEMIDFLKKIEVKKLRVDYGFDLEQIKIMYKYFKIILNASTIDKDKCNDLEKIGINLSDITACHNFYPRRETGLSSKIFLKQNEVLKNFGIKIQAFIPGDENLRGPLFDGLPTLEKHRYKDPLFTYIDMKENYLIDEVLVGDISIKDTSLERIKNYEEGVITLRVKDFKSSDKRIKDIFFGNHRNRKDFSDFVVRSATTRIDIDFKVEPENNLSREIGSVTIDNKNYGRYNGEIQITKKDLERDDRVNVLAKIDDRDIDILQFIHGGKEFKFIEE